MEVQAFCYKKLQIFLNGIFTQTRDVEACRYFVDERLTTCRLNGRNQKFTCL